MLVVQYSTPNTTIDGTRAKNVVQAFLATLYFPYLYDDKNFLFSFTSLYVNDHRIIFLIFFSVHDKALRWLAGAFNRAAYVRPCT
jgi:hypothetical protein